MYLAYLLLITGLTISGVAIYYSVIGMAAIFAAAPIPIYIMGTTLEIAKLVGASWLKAHWDRSPGFIKSYMMLAILVLMMITSMGIFGFLSKAHMDQNLVSGEVVDKIGILDEKIRTQRDNIDAARKALVQMDQSVDQTMARSTSEKGAGRAVEIRRTQSKERSSLRNEIETAQREIAKLNEERAPIAKDLRKVEAEVGPIKYIAALIYGDNPNQNILEKAVTWVIIMIVVVFDPLAVVMLIAAQMTFSWYKPKKVLPIDQPIVNDEESGLETDVLDLQDWSCDEDYFREPEDDVISKEARRYHPTKKQFFVKKKELTSFDVIEDYHEYAQRLSLKPIDQLYKEYNKDQFKGLIIDPKELELARFIENSKDKARFNNYSADKLEYFARRIYELRKNHSNNTAG